MQNILVKLFQSWFKFLEIVLPPIARKWSVKLFFTPMRFKRPYREEAFQQKAKATKIAFQIDHTELYNLEYAKGRVLGRHFNESQDKTFYIQYELGDGPLILLVHGWSGRGSQMGTIAEALVKQGFKIVTFDAYAHGNSPGKQTTVMELARIIKDIQQHFGTFEAIIGHSMGGIAAGIAIADGVKSKQLVTMGSPTTFKYILESFCTIINASQKTQDYIKAFSEKYGRITTDSISLANRASSLKLPGLIIHDKDDKEADYKQALLFDKMWPEGELFTTTGLGHSRILRDEKVIKKIITFVLSEKLIEA